MPLPYNRFVKQTTIVSAASDSNDGLDPLGCALATASYDHTGGGTGERQLTAGSGTPFANVQAGDYIYLTFGGGTSVDGLYEIETASSSTVVLLAADAGLIDDSTSNVTSSDGPWLTLQHSLDNVAVDETVVWCDDGDGTGTDWEPAVTLDVDAVNGAFGTPIEIRGGTSRGVVDGATFATVSGAALGLTDDLMEIGTGASTIQYYIWRDIRFTGATRYNVFNDNGNCAYHQWERCRIDNADSHGMARESAFWTMSDCEIDSNGGNGLMLDNTTQSNRAQAHIIRCRFHDNTTHGMVYSQSMFFLGCLFYDNGSDGLHAYRMSHAANIDSCVFEGNGGDGLGTGSTQSTVAAPHAISNSVFANNGAYGIGWDSYYEWQSIKNCFFYNNTSGHYTSNLDEVVAAPGSSNTEGTDPEFTSLTDGSEDFTPADGSPLIDAGIEVPTA